MEYEDFTEKLANLHINYAFKVLEYEDFTEQLANHHNHLLMEIERRIEELPGDSPSKHLEHTSKELKLLIDGGNKGHLEWGIFVLQKPG